MRTKLLVAGTVLVLLAVGSDRHWLSGRDVSAEVATQDPDSTAQMSLADRAVHSVSDAFDAVLSEAVLTGIKNAEQALQQYEPTLRVTYGDTGRRARRLAEEVTAACAKARAELEAGRTSIALDDVIQASRDLDQLKVVFERR
jgi:hypothetical protein